MNLAVKFIFFCLTICAALSSIEVNNYVREGEACSVEYLQSKGKLSEKFLSSQPASSQCRLVIPLTIQVINTIVHDMITKEIPAVADCLIEELDNKGAIDYIILLNVVTVNRFLNETERQAQFNTTRNDFRVELEEIASHCQIDSRSFIKIFNGYLGVKDESLDMVKQEYCLVKYVADNKIVDLGNVETNSKNIDHDTVICDGIVEADRRKTEGEVMEKITDKEVLSCATDYYMSNKIYDSIVGLEVLRKVDLPAEAKEVETNRLTDNLVQFFEALYSCRRSR